MSAHQDATDRRLRDLDGFRVEVDPARERADIVLARPPMNTISMTQRDQLRHAFETLDEDSRVRVIVLRAEGEHFSSGGYIRGFLEASPEHVSKLAWNVAAPARCAKPVIAANRGYAFGVGFEISLACDFRVVSETCRYALPEQKLGQIPGSGGSARLQKIVGITRTKDIVMRSKRIPGRQALEWGIATECVPDDKLYSVQFETRGSNARPIAVTERYPDPEDARPRVPNWTEYKADGGAATGSAQSMRARAVRQQLPHAREASGTIPAVKAPSMRLVTASNGRDTRGPVTGHAGE